MTAIDFPANPTVGQQLSVGLRTWTWSGTVWELSARTYGNLDGGRANTNYGGISPIQGGNATGA